MSEEEGERHRGRRWRAPQAIVALGVLYISASLRGCDRPYAFRDDIPTQPFQYKAGDFYG